MEHIYEVNCECLNCHERFCFSNKDIARDKAGRWDDLASTINLVSGSKIEKAIALNHQNTAYQTDFNKCPYCGSRKITKEESDYYVDNYGNYVEDYEPGIDDKILETGGKVIGGIGNFLFKGCLLAILIPVIAVVYYFLKAIIILFF